MKTICQLAAIIAMAAFTMPATAGDVLIDFPVGPVVEVTAPVAATDDVIGYRPGAGSGTQYEFKFGKKTADLWPNQCWTNHRKVRKTAGQQGPDEVCVTITTSLATSIGGGSRYVAKAGTAYVPGQYEQDWFGVQEPILEIDEHDLVHKHEWEQ